MSDTDALIAQLKSGRDIERREAARQLGLSGDKTAIEPLKNALSDTNYSVATAAASALEKLGVHSAVPSALEPTKPTKLGVVSKAIAAASDKIKRGQEPKRREQEWIRQSQREQERIIEEQPRLRQERMRQDALRLREARIRQPAEAAARRGGSTV
jgi:HEAT repeat protein